MTEAGDVIRLTPLALAALHEQLVDVGVDIPLLPPTAAELTGGELLAMAGGVREEELEAEADAWVEARGAGAAAVGLLKLAAAADPGSGSSRWPPSSGSARRPNRPGVAAWTFPSCAATRRSRC